MKLDSRLYVAGILAVAVQGRAATLNVLPLGDSITSGYAYYTMGPGYREYLLNDLTSAGISIQYQGALNSDQSNDYGYSANLVADNQNYNDGFVGYQSVDILNNLDGNVPSSFPYPNAGGYWITGGNGTGRDAIYPDIVLLIIGNNDMGSRGGASTIDPNDLGILNWFNTNRPNTEVIIAAPPPGSGSTDLPQTELVNSYLTNLVATSFPQDRVADVCQTMLNPDGTLNSSRLSPDGLHPLDVGYTGIAEALYAAVAASVPNTGKVQVKVGPLDITGTTDQWTSRIDLGGQDMIVVEGDLATITNQVKSGYDGGSWTGNGITTTTAASDTSHLTALGIMQNNVGYSGAPLYSTFDGIASTDADVLIKFTDFGDANLDGTVDASDYSLIDNGCLQNLTGWYNGDFNYDGVVDGSDYTLMDNSFNTQGVTVTTAVANPTAISAAGMTGGSSIPEPGSAGLLCLGTMGVLGKRRRQRVFP